MTVMPFGKFAGRPITEVPQRYLHWTLEKYPNLTDALREDIEAVLNGLPLPERDDGELDTLEKQLSRAMGKR
jgi:hypothetical protein